jgi:hypothetical protein
MANLNTNSEQANNQPLGQQENGLPLDIPTTQVLDSDMIEQQSTNQTPLWFSLEQHRLQLDQVLQLYVSDFLYVHQFDFESWIDVVLLVLLFLFLSSKK